MFVHILLTWIALKPDDVFNIQYNIIIIDSTRGQHWKLSPLENHCQPGLRLGFLASRAVNIHILHAYPY